MRKSFLITLALLEWAALITQFILMMNSDAAPVAELLQRFITFFTITTNCLVGIYAVAILINPNHHFFANPFTQTAIVMYITVVGLIYNLILRQLGPFPPLQTVIHETLHTVIPIMVIIYWAIWVDARSVNPNRTPRWLIYPAIYTLVVLLRGSYAHWYPYPFLDLTKLPPRTVIRNCGAVMGVFVAFTCLYYYWGKRKSTHQ